MGALKLQNNIRELILPTGEITTIDEIDYEHVSAFRWCAQYANEKCYVGRRKSVDNPHSKLHRFILNAPAGKFVDHIDGNTLNNCRSNLRLCTHAENRRNSRRNKNNKCGFKGVSFDKCTGTYRAKIMFDGRVATIGRYKTAERAAKAYENISRLCFGKFHPIDPNNRK